MNRFRGNIILVLIPVFFTGNGFAQISPGELSKAHAHLEGLSNCTKCHILGEKETTAKCLECHKEIKNQIAVKKGYHASSEVQGKKCAECHGEHFGRDFQLVRFDENNFNHNLTGYQLEGKHSEIKCADCHKPELIHKKLSQKKGETYLGLGTDCLSCHDDYHQNTLSNNCITCHNQEKFRPAPLFNHAKTEFPLIGKHLSVDCAKCHKTELRNGNNFQQFVEIEFASCTNCHEDVHKNKFGSDCLKCHSEFSFHEVKNLTTFNHEKTDYPLRGRHVYVDCKKCHKVNYTKALAHSRCTSCHNDYHEKQFLKNGVSPDCNECHSINGFSPSHYGIEKHNQTAFKLEGGHMATPCFDCHKKEEKWNFNIENQCINCHENIHKNYITEKYIPEDNCKSCHSVNAWKEVSFDHKTTDFELLGKHQTVSCRECHFKNDDGKKVNQQFKWENQNCTSCHNDIHFNQFDISGLTRCENCHTNDNWKPDRFNHNNTRFQLDGKHEGLECKLCHKPTSGLSRNYIVYKFEDISCKSCH